MSDELNKWVALRSDLELLKTKIANEDLSDIWCRNCAKNLGYVRTLKSGSEESEDWLCAVCHILLDFGKDHKDSMDHKDEAKRETVRELYRQCTVCDSTSDALFFCLQ